MNLYPFHRLNKLSGGIYIAVILAKIALINHGAGAMLGENFEQYNMRHAAV